MFKALILFFVLTILFIASALGICYIINQSPFGWNYLNTLIFFPALITEIICFYILYRMKK